MDESKVTLEAIGALLDSKLDEKLQPLKFQVEDLSLTIESLKSSLQFISDKYDNILKSVQNLKTGNTALQLENKSLKHKVFNLRRDLDQSRTVTNNMEQYSRRDCIEIKGIPGTPEEDTTSIAIKTASLMGLTLSREDISISHRLSKPSYSEAMSGPTGTGERRGTPNIIVKFVRRETRDAFYRARRKLAGKTTDDLDLGRYASNNIYISESLSPANRELFKSCLTFKKNRKYRFIWTHNGRIYLRKEENSPAIMINSQKDLEIPG